jgi:CRISPR-associated endonuclease/helicase Cas3
MDLGKYLAKPDKSLLEHTQDVRKQLELMNKLGYIENERIYCLTGKACNWHDYGKVNREFQKRIRSHSKFNENTEIAHNILSLYLINPNDFDTDEDYMKVAEAVLTHHNYCDEGEVINHKSDLIKSLLFEYEIEHIGTRKLRKIMSMIYDDETIMIKGLLHRCDYSASAGITVEYANDFLIIKLNKMMENWKVRKPETSWNDLQKFCLEHTNDNIIVTAQTGMGKTEAGLLWLGNNKGFFILPIKIAINTIYDRIKNDILNYENLDERLALLHSDTLSYYIENGNYEEATMSDYYSRTKQLSMPITVTTLDQIFDFVFKYPGYEMKLATLSYSKLIIDEIQMYAPDLLAYLTCGIKMVNKFGGKIAILTATLSPFVKDILKEKGFIEDVVEDGFVNDIQRHNLKVYKTEIDTTIIYDKYIENKENDLSNKILIVCNTVKKAQEIYKNLSEAIDIDEMHILHNKFIKKDRSKKEKEILKFGKTYDEIGEIYKLSGIWVSTSIVEASLDIDFDYIFTELSDINGLFQRLGRCNRKGIKNVTDYNCVVFTEIDKNIIRHNGKGFIDETVYKLSKEALENIDGILSEAMKVHLIDTYFITEKLRKSTYMKDFNDVYNYISNLIPNEVNKDDAKLRNILTYCVMPEAVYSTNYNQIQINLEKLSNKTISIAQRIVIMNQIRQYTLSVEPYILKNSKITNSIKLRSGEVINVIDCNYSEVGFQMKKNSGYTLI